MKRVTIAVVGALVTASALYVVKVPTRTPQINITPPPPYSTNWPPIITTSLAIDTNQLWLSISQNDTTITITVNKMTPSHSYYLWATHSYTPTNWILVTPFGPASTYSLVFPKSSLFTNGAPMLFFRTQDVTP